MCRTLPQLKFAIEENWFWALAAIVFAAYLDGIDGRVARFLKGTSRFGAELDSFSDFLSFGVAPAMILYLWILDTIPTLGWIAAMIFAICNSLRLARFNLSIDEKKKEGLATVLFSWCACSQRSFISFVTSYTISDRPCTSTTICRVWCYLFYNFCCFADG